MARSKSQLEAPEAVACFSELGTYERHFNEVQGRYRTLASTWLLGTVAAIGFILTNELNLSVERFLLVAAIAVAAAIGVTLLWHLDLIVYHGLLHAPFVAGLVLEEARPEMPKMRHLMRANMRGDAAARVVYFYLGCTAALLLVAVVAIAISAFGDIPDGWALLIVVVAVLVAVAWVGAIKWLTVKLSTLPLPGESSQPWHERVDELLDKSEHTPPVKAPPPSP